MEKNKKAHSNSLFRKIISMIVTVCMVVGCLPTMSLFAEDVAYDSNKIDVWDFGPTALDTSKYNNMLTVDIINSWYPEGTVAGSKDNKFPTSFTAGDLSFSGRAGSNRLRTTNTAVTRFDEGNSVTSIKGFDCTAEKIEGCYYGNGASAKKQGQFSINCLAGDIIYVYAKMDNAADVMILEKDGNIVAQGDVATDGNIVKLVAPEDGTYSLHDGETGKLRLYRITREHAKFATVSGAVTAPDSLSGYSVIFRNDETGAEVEATPANGSYSASIPQGYTYSVLLKNAKGYIIKTGTAIDKVATDAVTHNLEIVAATYHNYSGKFSGFAEDYTRVSEAKFYYEPVNKDDKASYGNVDVALGDYSIDLAEGVTYKFIMEGVNDYKITAGEDVTVGTTDVTQDITVAPKATYDVQGGFVAKDGSAVAPASVVFTNLDDSYTYTATIADGKYSLKLRDGEYKVAADVADYNQATYAIVNGAAVTKDIYYIPAIPAKTALVKDVYVDQVDGENHYKTLKEAIDVVNNMDPQPASEEDRITIHIAPGTYRAQYKLTTPYVSLINTDPSKEVLVTWYYGIGYKYYSADGTGYYNELNATDKVLKNGARDFDGVAVRDVDRWGGTFSIKSSATNFYAENIKFENSFNKYVTEEEIADGVEPDLTEAIRVDRTATGLDVKTKTATERAAALISEADNAEFYKCSFSSSQDTLYINPIIRNYYKDCFVEGMTDYIFGDGQVVFDDCTLNFCNYSDLTDGGGGKITATKYDQGGCGYIFNECTVTGTVNEKGVAGSGHFGRPWGGTSTVKFINTTLAQEGVISAAGWDSMSGNTPEKANYYEYNTKYADGTAFAGSKSKILTDDDVKALSIQGAFGDWTPKNYDANDEIKVTGSGDTPTDPTTSDSAIETTTVGSETTTEGSEGTTLALGDFNSDTNIDANDASQLLSYILDKNSVKATAAQLDAAEVTGDGRITALDVSQILAKSLNNDFVFTRKDYNPSTGGGSSKPTEGTTSDSKETTTEAVETTTEATETTTEGTSSDKVTVWTLGDSTVCNYVNENVEGYNYRQGWGMRLGDYLTDDVEVKNIARSGRSLRDFRIYEGTETGPYADFLKNVKPGDYVLIQFGHNDQKEPLTKSKDGSTFVVNGNYGKTDANGGISAAAGLSNWKNADENGYLTVEGVPSVEGTCTEGGKLPSFEAIYYKDYIKVAVEKGAKPILVTPVVRGNGTKDANGKYPELTSIDQTHEKVKWKVIGPLVKTENLTSMDYVQAVKDVAAYATEQLGVTVPVVDLYADSCKYWLDYIAANGTANDLHANDGGTVGIKDRTHLSKQGASAAAGLVAKSIVAQGLDMAKYVKSEGGSDTPAETTTAASVETTTEAPTETTTVAPAETTTEAPAETTTEGTATGDISFSDVDSFEGYIAEDNKDSIINLADTTDIAGNTTTKIFIGNKAVQKQFEAPATSGKYEFSTDFYTDNLDTAKGRSFRIYMGSDNVIPADTMTTITDENAKRDIKGADKFFVSPWTNTGIFYHLTDIAGGLYSVTADNPGYGTASAADSVALNGLESNKWYHIVVSLDLDAKTATTKVYLHGADGTWAPETEWTTPVSEGTSPFVEKATTALANIRLVRTAGGNVYFDNVKLTKVQ